MSNAWCKAANAFIWTGSGMNLSANPKAIDEATREHYSAIYARPGAMYSAFEQFAAFSRDATDNKAFAANGKLTMPVLAIGAEKSFGTAMADEIRFVAIDVTALSLQILVTG